MVGAKDKHSPKFKLKVASEALCGQWTLAELSSKYRVHASEICRWKKRLAESGERLFEKGFPENKENYQSKMLLDLQLQAAKQALMLDIYKRKIGDLSPSDRRELINPNHSDMTISEQCDMYGLQRSTYYYKQAPESDLNLRLRKLIDEVRAANPKYGRKRVTSEINTILQPEGITVNIKRIDRLMKDMGL
jgi:putative transposase